MTELKSIWGMSQTIDLKKCHPKSIRSEDHIRKYVIELCDLIQMKRFGEMTIVHFGEDEKVAGYSMFQLIETSCISGHFANKTNNAYIDIFSCKSFNTIDSEEFSKKYFDAKESDSKVILRF